MGPPHAALLFAGMNDNVMSLFVTKCRRHQSQACGRASYEHGDISAKRSSPHNVDMRCRYDLSRDEIILFNQGYVFATNIKTLYSV